MVPAVLERPRVIPRVKPGLSLDGGKPLFLNLGGLGDNGEPQLLEGFLTVDISNSPLVDIQTDVSDLSMIGTETVYRLHVSCAAVSESAAF